MHTLRYYERAGLVVTPIERTAGGRRRYQQLDLDWITVCTKLRATGMPIKTIRRYAELVSAGYGNEQERLALLEAHRAEVTAELAELRNNLKLIEHKIDVYRGRLAAGDADQLWAPHRQRLSAERSVFPNARRLVSRQPTAVRSHPRAAAFASYPVGAAAAQPWRGISPGRAPQSFGWSAPGGPLSTVGTYSRSWSRRSNVWLVTSSRATSG